MLLIIYLLSFFVVKCYAKSKIMSQLLAFTKHWTWNLLIIYYIIFYCTTTIFLCIFYISIIIATLLLKIAILPLLNELVFALISIYKKSFLLYCRICSINIITDIKWFLIFLLWFSLKITFLLYKDFLTTARNWQKSFIIIIKAILSNTAILLLFFFWLN